MPVGAVETTVIAAAAKPFFDRLIACIWDDNTRRANYVRKFKKNHEDLKTERRRLQSQMNDVKRKVQVAENDIPGMKCKHVVAQWIESVDIFEKEADLISSKCSGEIDKRGCGGYGAERYSARYTLGKEVSKKLKEVQHLINLGEFDIVVDKSLPERVQREDDDHSVGDGKIFTDVWKGLGNDAVHMIGIYGMGGIGKTTLLKKLNNAFLSADGALSEQANTFDIVISVRVSREFILQDLQKKIGSRLGLTWSEDVKQEERAERISHALMRRKRFLVLLDDVWQPLVLKNIGIPSQKNSKVLFTTRSENACREMNCHMMLKIPFLAENYALDLFNRSVGKDGANYSPEVPELAEEVAELSKEVAEECGGLPLALIIIGKAMAPKETADEWKEAINTLKYHASRILDMEKKVLAILKFSYDAIKDEKVRNCFLYCSLYPEDCSINKLEIIQSWIGEGFLGLSRGMDDAVEKGRYIIMTLKDACLLEGDCGRYSVKMHGIVRDLALWIGREENNFLVEAGFGSTQVPDYKSWKKAARISLMENEIKELAGAPNCPRLETLMLRRNNSLTTILGDFFLHMPNLRVLDLSETSIQILPRSIGRLSKLQFLNLFETDIKTLPDELVKLVNLNYLNLDTNGPMTIPHALLSGFTRMEVLLSGSAFAGDGNRSDSIRALKECDLFALDLQQSMNVGTHIDNTSITSLVIFRSRSLDELRSSPLQQFLKRRRVLGIEGGKRNNQSDQHGQRYRFIFDFAEVPPVGKWKSVLNFGQKMIGIAALDTFTI